MDTEKNRTFIKDTVIQFLHLFEVILSILQDIENYISFEIVGLMYSNIIEKNDLLEQLIEGKYILNQFPINFQKLIKSTIML